MSESERMEGEKRGKIELREDEGAEAGVEGDTETIVNTKVT